MFLYGSNLDSIGTVSTKQSDTLALNVFQIFIISIFGMWWQPNRLYVKKYYSVLPWKLSWLTCSQVWNPLTSLRIKPKQGPG